MSLTDSQCNQNTPEPEAQNATKFGWFILYHVVLVVQAYSAIIAKAKGCHWLSSSL